MTHREGEKQNIRRRLWLLAGLLVYFAVAYGVMHLLDITCVFQHLLGVPCPGCGMTRAALALLRLDLAAAWGYNPLVFAMPYVLFYLFFDLRPPRLHRFILLAIGLLTLIHWTFVLFQH